MQNENKRGLNYLIDNILQINYLKYELNIINI